MYFNELNHNTRIVLICIGIMILAVMLLIILVPPFEEWVSNTRSMTYEECIMWLYINGGSLNPWDTLLRF